MQRPGQCAVTYHEDTRLVTQYTTEFGKLSLRDENNTSKKHPHKILEISLVFARGWAVQTVGSVLFSEVVNGLFQLD